MSKYPQFRNSAHAVVTAATLSFSLILAGTPVQAGPAVNANVHLFDRNGGLIDGRIGNPFANYQTALPSNIPFPVRVQVFGGTDLVTGLPLQFTHNAVVLSAAPQRINVNAYSTLAVEMARGMTNGFNATNFASANATLVREFNFGLVTTTVPDPMTSVITPQNVANLVRAAEAVGEVVRRTHTALGQAGVGRSADDIVRALAADLRDGRLDGRGAAPTDARIAATANVVSAQVIVEAMRNRLYVNGTLATGAMNNAIRTLMPTTTVYTDKVPVSAAMLIQAQRLLAAVRAFDTRTQIADLARRVSHIPANSSAAQIRTGLTESHSQLLDVSVVNVARAPSTSLQAVNAVMAAGTAQPVAGITNRAPTISGTPQVAVAAGTAYRFQPTASDPDGNPLSFSIVNKPAWASFNGATGALTGAPTAAGTFGSVTIRVSDGRLTTSLPAFTIAVTSTPSANRAPTISGTPATAVNVGSIYNFAPTAVDMDGNAMIFSITNKPVWATFNATTGRLSGTPTAANVGTYGNIVIRVSDGRNSTVLPSFSIRVNGTTSATPITRNVTLRWVAPAARSNGTALSLSQIAGYRIRYGTSAGNYTQSAMNRDGDTAHTVQGLSAGTYYFVINTIDTGGRESNYTSPVTARVQ